MIAKQTSPLAKGIRTLEGQVVVVTNLIIGAGAVIDPNRFSPKIAGIIIGVMNLALIVQRGVIKVQASKVINQIIDSTDPLKTAEEEFFGQIVGPTLGATDPPPASAIKPDLNQVGGSEGQPTSEGQS